MVLVSVSGKVSQQMLVLGEPVTQERLSATADLLNSLYSGREADEISAMPADLDALGSDMKKLVLDEMRNTGEMISGEVYQDGWTNVLGEPEFSNTEAAQRALRILEERPLLEDLLSQTVMNTEIGGVQVLIGGEGTWEELSDCSLVLARYGVPELASGILGVLGPIRMPYRQTISTVNYMAGLMSNLINESMSDSPEQE